MSVSYGEGRKAFFRLQEEIIKNSTDHSIFGWLQRHDSREPVSSANVGCPLFAESPADFADSRNVVANEDYSGEQRPYAMTNMGLEMKIGLTPISLKYRSDGEFFFVHLNCTSGKFQKGPYEGWMPRLGDIYKMVLKRGTGASKDVFTRVRIDEADVISMSKDVLTDQVIYISIAGEGRKLITT